MDLTTTTLFCTTLVVLYISTAYSLPLDVAPGSEEEDHLLAKRPKYMDTRDLDDFTELTWIALKQLASDGKLNPDLISIANENEDEVSKTDKRAHLRICLRRSGSRFIPYPCYRRGRR